jgi:Protein of unknown function (DUF2971)
MTDMHPFRSSDSIRAEIVAEQWVYKYMSAKTAINYVLSNATLRMNPLALMNDPRESKQWKFNISSPNDFEEPPSDVTQRWFQKIQVAMTNWPKLYCVSMDDPRYIGSPYSEFGRGFLKPRMWAQYGDNHKGVCLVFDKALLNDAISKAGCDEAINGKVYYDFVGDIARVPTYFMLKDSDHVDFDLPKLQQRGEDEIFDQMKAVSSLIFFAKHQDWAAENEYRWIVIRKDDQPIDFPFKNSLVGVVIGQDAEPDSEAEIVNLGNKFGIPVVKYYWSNCIACRKLLNNPKSILGEWQWQ